MLSFPCDIELLVRGLEKSNLKQCSEVWNIKAPHDGICVLSASNSIQAALKHSMIYHW